MTDSDNIFQSPAEMGITPFAEDSSDVVTDIVPVVETEPVDPFKQIETNIEFIIGKGKNAVNDLYNLAKSTDDPRVYRVLSEMITSVVAANKELFDVHKVKKELEFKMNPVGSAQTINNNALIIGTTSDINKLLAQMNLPTSPLVIDNDD